MMISYYSKNIPKTRLATIDICDIGKRKHHIVAFLELNISSSRKKLKIYRQNNNKVSLIGWLVKVISYTINNHKEVASIQVKRNRIVIFDDVNVSFLIEKEVNGSRVPIPLLIKSANQISMEQISEEIIKSKEVKIGENDIVLEHKTTIMEQIYYYLPGFLRKLFWKYLLRSPKQSFERIGNVAITSLGMFGKINAWFVPISIHPICFGISSITKKAIVIDDQIEIGEVLNISVLIDHDVIDGAPMARFINELSRNIESGLFL